MVNSFLNLSSSQPKLNKCYLQLQCCYHTTNPKEQQRKYQYEKILVRRHTSQIKKWFYFPPTRINFHHNLCMNCWKIRLANFQSRLSGHFECYRIQCTASDLIRIQHRESSRHVQERDCICLFFSIGKYIGRHCEIRKPFGKDNLRDRSQRMRHYTHRNWYREKSRKSHNYIAFFLLLPI